MSNYRSTAFSAPNMAAVDQAAAAAAAAAGRPSPSKVASPAADFGAPRSWPVDEPVYKSVGVAAYAPSAPSFGAFDDGEKTVYRSMQHHETYRSMELDEHVAGSWIVFLEFFFFLSFFLRTRSFFPTRAIDVPMHARRFARWL